MWRNIASNGLSLLGLALFLITGLVLWGQSAYQRPGPLASPICYSLKPGSTLRRVADELAQQGAIDSAAVFRIGMSYGGKAQDLKAGHFLLPEGISMRDLGDEITHSGAPSCGSEIVYRLGIGKATAQLRSVTPETGKYEDRAEVELTKDAVWDDVFSNAYADGSTRHRVAFADGMTSWQMVQGLLQIPALAGDVAKIPAEGSLSPDSYEFTRGANRADVLARMQAAQDSTLMQAWEERAEGLPYASPAEALIMASIIEKETGVADERALVASVFINRLNRGMRLQTDPTVIYGITRGEGVLGRGLRRSELDRVTPYNTYQIDGLPPTPIANPGRASIRAALNPATSDYLFFVADGTGGHAFAKTLAEHNRNVAAWRKIEAQRAN